MLGECELASVIITRLRRWDKNYRFQMCFSEISVVTKSNGRLDVYLLTVYRFRITLRFTPQNYATQHETEADNYYAISARTFALWAFPVPVYRDGYLLFDPEHRFRLLPTSSADSGVAGHHARCVDE